MEIWAVIVPAVKFALYLSILLSAGGHLFLLVFGGDMPSSLITKSLRRRCRNMASVALGLSILSLFVMSGSLGGDLASVFDLMLVGLVIDSPAGEAIMLQSLGLILLVAGTSLPRGTGRWTLGDIGGGLGVIIALLAFTRVGHVTIDAPLLQILLAIHLLGIVFWLGALLPLLRLCNDDVPLDILAGVSHQFGRYALVLVGGLVASGMGYAYVLVGSPSQLFGSSYGQFLLVKIALVAAMLWLAALNKLRLVPRLLAGDEGARAGLASSIKYEITLACCILGVTSLLTTSLALPIL